MSKRDGRSKPEGQGGEGTPSSDLSVIKRDAPLVSVSSTLGSIRPEKVSGGIASRAIGNVTVKPEPGVPNVTRQGAPRMTFLPNRPIRRNVVPEESSSAGPSTPIETQADRGRGRGRGRGLGRGRGASGSYEAVQMVASGPFALGPAASGGSNIYGRKPQAAFSSVGLGGPSRTELGSGLSHSAAPSLKKDFTSEKELEKDLEEDEETMSNDEDGLEKVNMEFVGKMDWNAPVALKHQKETDKKKVKKEGGSSTARVKFESQEEGAVQKSGSASITIDNEIEDKKDLANALDLSASEDEEEVEDLVEYFTRRNARGEQILGENILFFQFPSPFPMFASPSDTVPIDVDADPPAADTKGKGKAVSWAPDVKVESSVKAEDTDGKQKETQALDGTVGQMEIYKSGAIKMRLGKNVVMDVIPATQPAFLQQAVHVDMTHKRLVVLAEVTHRFVVTPDVEMLLDELDGKLAEVKTDPILEGLETMAMDVDG